jgi:hypothetical protein
MVEGDEQIHSQCCQVVQIPYQPACNESRLCSMQNRDSTVTSAPYTVVSVFRDKSRDSKLLITNFFEPGEYGRFPAWTLVCLEAV